MSPPSVKDDTKDSDTKQILYLSTLSSNTMTTYTPKKNDYSDNQLYEDMLTNYNLSPINSTSNESNIQQEINTLKEMVVSLYKQINEKQTVQDQQTQCSTSYRDASTQTTDSMMPSKPKTVSRHTETSVINTKEISIQTDSAPLFIPKTKNFWKLHYQSEFYRCAFLCCVMTIFQWGRLQTRQMTKQSGSLQEVDDIINIGLDLLIRDDVDFGRKSRKSSTFFESDSSNSSSTGVGGDDEKPHDVKL